MLKISRSGATIKAEGTLGGAWVSELEGACMSALAERRRITLDLASVAYVDRSGAALIERLRADDRITFGKVSAFVAEMMKGERHDR